MGEEPVSLKPFNEDDLLVPGRRALAAIVFTDAVGFSALASRHEDRALKLIQDDARVMRDLCREFNGQTIKSTGDGLMMVFTSAVDALRFILACLSALSERMGEDSLKHRLGAHLGDVVIHADDVLGDGVNIAARLQQIAPPGEAYISSALFDMVRGKVIFDSHLIGPCELKNIDAPVTVWGIKPGTGLTIIEHPPRKVSRWWVGFGLTATVAVVLACVGYIGHIGPFGASDHLKLSASHNGGPKEVTPTTDSKVRQLQSTYDFDRIVAFIQTDPVAKNNYTADDVDAYSSLAEFRRWIESRLATASEKSPVRGSGQWEDKTHNLQAWADQGNVVIVDGDKDSTVPFEDIPAWQLRILSAGAALQDSNASSEDVVQWLAFFDEAYQLSS